MLPFGRVSSWLALLVDLSHGIAVLVTGLATTDLRLELILPGHLAVVAWRPGSLIVSAAFLALLLNCPGGKTVLLPLLQGQDPGAHIGFGITLRPGALGIPTSGCVLGILSSGSRLLAGSVVSVLLLLLGISLPMLLLGVLVVSLLVLRLRVLAVVPTGLGLSVAGLVTPTRLQMILRLVQFSVLPAAMRLRRCACHGCWFLLRCSSGRSQMHNITRLGLHNQANPITGYFFALSGPGNLCQHQ